MKRTSNIALKRSRSRAGAVVVLLHSGAQKDASWRRPKNGVSRRHLRVCAFRLRSAAGLACE